MSNIDLLLDEENELTFALKIEGTRPATAKCRLVLENKDMSLVFNSDTYDGEEVSVVLPPLGHVLKEGQYNMNLEVIVEDKFFKPLTLVGNFEKSISIVAETVAKKKEVLKPQVSLSNVSVKRRKKPSFDKPAQKIKRKTNQVLESKTKITDKDIMSLIEALKSR
jgi:hypothetical protein|tara:strand:+ start:1273 stop:1767 length:495 start_codon:yes stop_codon:yes gene_type:complete